jgi:mannose-6-phosphate isomerase-like protein (cupin superfamily)
MLDRAVVVKGGVVSRSDPSPPVRKPSMTDNATATGRFDIQAIADALPETATTLLADTYLTDRPEASARVFRVYRPTPPHYHATCDEYLYVFSGRGTFWMGDESTKAEFSPGQLLFFKRGTVHAMPELFDHPVVFLSIDTPRREPTDIIFVDPKDGSPETFMARNAAGE